MALNKINTSVSLTNQTSASIRERRLLNTLPLVRRMASAKLRDHYRISVDDLVQTIFMNLWRWQRRENEKQSAAGGIPPVICDPTQITQINSNPVRYELPDYRTLESESNRNDLHSFQALRDQADNEISDPREAEDSQNRDETPELDQESWMKVAATATRNEVNSFYASKYRREIVVDEYELLLVSEKFYESCACRVEGETRTETDSLLAYLWRKMQSLSLRRRYALLLNKDEFIDELIAGGVCSLSELAEYFELEKEEFLSIVEQLPLSDERIAELIANKLDEKVTIKQIWTWRAKAKMNLASAISGICGAMMILVLGWMEILEICVLSEIL